MVIIAVLSTMLTPIATVGATATSSSSILSVGTIFYADSLNPNIGIEPQDDTIYGMVYPQLVQYGPGQKLVGDWASSWTQSANGMKIIFHLRPGKWSDGVPLTAADAVWSIEATLKYKSGPTAYLAGTLSGVKDATAPNANTLVINYAQPVAAALANLQQFFILPKHVWSLHTGNNGKDLLSYFPEQHLPLVSGGAYYVTQFQEKGTTVLRPNPGFYGPRSHVAAVALTYYTNATSMIADLEAGKVDFIDALPYVDANKVQNIPGVVVTNQPGNEVTNLGFNSNPAKPKNRELLNTTVREAFEYAIPRQKIVQYVFGGHATAWANILSPWSQASGWINPAVKPLSYNVNDANALLDKLGYKRGANGTRVVPATTGKFAQAAHPMSYNVIVPNDLDFDGNLQFQILATAFAQIGVKLNEVSGGDGTQSYTMITAPNGKYLTADMYTWYWHPYIDPNFNLSVVTAAQWGNNSDTGMSSPTYDAWWAQQGTATNFASRQALVWKMEAFLAQQRPYIQLVDTNMITAHLKSWTGFEPNLWTFCKCYYTAPHPVSK